jgi:DNA phosphorothioation-dependent restriction protein DptG
MQKMISPNELHDAAKKIMLNGREPETDHDWYLVINFWASNVDRKVSKEICKLMRKIYDCPIEDKAIEEICKFQASRKSIRPIGQTQGE